MDYKITGCGNMGTFEEIAMGQEKITATTTIIFISDAITLLKCNRVPIDSECCWMTISMTVSSFSASLPNYCIHLSPKMDNNEI